MSTVTPNIYDQKNPPFKVGDRVALDTGGWEWRQGEEATITSITWWGLTWRITVLCEDGETEILEYVDCGNPETCCSTWATLITDKTKEL